MALPLAYREYGSGQALIILHGLFGQSDNWNTLAKQFAEKGFRVFAVDQRNHGLSPHSQEWSYEAMADDLQGFIQEHGLHQPVLLGHSMGGKTVLFHEALFPGQAQKVIVADIAPRAYPPHHDKVLAALHAVDFSVIHTRKEAEEVMHAHLSDFGTKQFLLKNIYWKDSAGNQMAWRFNLPVISHSYGNIGVAVPQFFSHTPALVIRGGKSDYVNEADIDDFVERFALLKVETIAEAGHWVHAEKPREFFDAVLNFITS